MTVTKFKNQVETLSKCKSSTIDFLRLVYLFSHRKLIQRKHLLMDELLQERNFDFFSLGNQFFGWSKKR